MRFINFMLVLLLLFSITVSSHTLQKTEIIKSDEVYNIKFSSNPEFPITVRNIHLDFEFWDNTGKFLDNLNFRVELKIENTAKILQTKKDNTGHYSVEINEKEAGIYTITPLIENKRLEIAFELFIDTFGLNGILTLGIIVFITFILLFLMYKDCRGGKHGKKRTNIKNARM